MWPTEEFDYIKLPDDDEGLHYGLFDGGELVSGVSLFIQGKEAQFRKFATRTERQNCGYGSKLLTYVLKEAKRRGVKQIYCNARVSKVPFYEKFGLSRTDVVFNKGGKDYVVMERCC
ncbi:GNAT family N-acetyltransferase [Saccharibacillus sp. O16]|nr:GNAT family N-acetyltransferase [Saccharibacillus sp. O16]